MQLFWVILLNTIANTGIGVLLPIMPVLLQSYGFSISGLSLPFLAIVFGRIISKLFCGKLLVLQYKYISIIAFTLYSFIFILYSIFRTKLAFIGLRFLEGLVEGIVIVMLTDVAIHLSQKHNRGFYMGIFGFSFGIGMIIGPLYGGILYVKYGVDGVFIANFILGIFGVICSFFLHKYNIHKKEKLKISFDVIKLMAYYSPAMLRRVYIFSLSIFLPIYTTDVLGLEVTDVAKLFSIIAVALIFFGPVSGRLVDKISARLVIIIGIFAMSLCSFAIFAGGQFYVFFGIMLIFFGCVLPAGMKFFADLVKEHGNRTQVLGIAGTTTEFATLFVAIIVPFIAQVNIMYVWLFLAAIGMLSVLPFLKKQ
ncbi:MAG: DHA1 family multidrug resistance protein-like MFS transporter [Candidatus Deianiraeaceae bacterium]|jgi:DHA1 family multidrug resistance protein-like MFS transporter